MLLGLRRMEGPTVRLAYIPPFPAFSSISSILREAHARRHQTLGHVQRFGIHSIKTHPRVEHQSSRPPSFGSTTPPTSPPSLRVSNLHPYRRLFGLLRPRPTAWPEWKRGIEATGRMAPDAMAGLSPSPRKRLSMKWEDLKAQNIRR